MKIIFVNQVTGPLLIDIINVFLKNNCEVILYTGRIEKTYADFYKSFKIRYLKNYKRNNSFNRIISWFFFFFQVFFYLIIDLNKKTKIYFSSNPPFIYFLNILFTNKSIIHIYDVYPDALLASKFITNKSLIYRLYSYLNSISFKKSEIVLTPSNGMKVMLSKYINKEKIEIVNWWANTDFIKPINKKSNKFLKKNKIDDKFIVLYSGNFGFTHNIEKILNAALELRLNNNIVFLLIGGGPKKSIVDNFQKKYKLNNLKILPFQDSKTLPYSIASGDISVVLDSFSKGNSKVSTASIPSKTYYLMASGSAIYAECDDVSELKMLIDKYEIGISEANKEILGFVNFIKYCESNKSKLDLFKSNSRKTSLNFTPKNAETLFNIIKNQN